jgi:hypothetical protein
MLLQSGAPGSQPAGSGRHNGRGLIVWRAGGCSSAILNAASKRPEACGWLISNVCSEVATVVIRNSGMKTAQRP